MNRANAAPGAGASPPILSIACALALASALSLGLARFSYALLLPAMRADLSWSYFTAGAMNMANAAGYLVGALLLPRAYARADARAVLLAGGIATAASLAAHGWVLGENALYGLRFASGVASAAVFVSGGLLAARLGSAAGMRAGLVLGIYYGGTGLGIVVSALLVPPIASGVSPHAWQGAWLALAAIALVAILVCAAFTRALVSPPAARAGARAKLRWSRFAFGLAGYLMFGLGYIGYMTFVITLLREQRVGDAQIVAFYVLLGVAVMVSSWLWASLLQRARGGGALALLNALLALATVLPVLSTSAPAVFASGALFGAVFLSVVASTTAMVRHNLPPTEWAAGIGAFTIVFAAGQIVGPGIVGWIADGSGGLRSAFAVSAAMLALGAALAALQKPLDGAGAQSRG